VSAVDLRLRLIVTLPQRLSVPTMVNRLTEADTLGCPPRLTVTKKQKKKHPKPTGEPVFEPTGEPTGPNARAPLPKI
jgi:hypothetical protein